MKEPNIIVNGIQLTTAQSMTVRVALESFILSLQMDGLGDDETGKAMTKGYLDRIWEIQRTMGLVKM
jgi:hypothetical protein